MAAGDLVADADFAHFGDVDTNLHEDTGLEVVAVLTSVDADVDYLTGGGAIHAD